MREKTLGDTPIELFLRDISAAGNMHLSMPYRRGGRGEGRAWGGDLIVFVGPAVGHLTDLVLPGDGIFEFFFARRGDILLPTRTKKTEVEHMFPRFHATRMRRTVWKNPEIMEANGNREFDGKFLKNLKSPPHALPPTTPPALH